MTTIDDGWQTAVSRIEAEARLAQGLHGADLIRAVARGLRLLASRAVPSEVPGPAHRLRLH